MDSMTLTSFIAPKIDRTHKANPCHTSTDEGHF